MQPGTWAAWAAVAVALLAVLLTLIVSWLSHNVATDALQESRRQTELQREVAESAAQPYVWADVRSSSATGTLLEVVVGNSGRTVATNVRVAFDPPLPVSRGFDTRDEMTSTALQRLAAGLNSLAPGKTLHWWIGEGGDLLESTEPQPHTVSINADGPFGPLGELKYVIDLADFRESNDEPDGTLHLLTRAVETGLGKVAKSL